MRNVNLYVIRNECDNVANNMCRLESLSLRVATVLRESPTYL